MLLRQDLTPGQTCATRAIGYRQAMEALQHWQADPPTATPAALVRRDSSDLMTLCCCILLLSGNQACLGRRTSLASA